VGYKDSKGNLLRLEQEPFASGGEGFIYRIQYPQQYSGYCVKIFRPNKFESRKNKIAYMIENPIILKEELNYRICWPIDFVFEETKAMGYIMKLAFEGSNGLYDLYLKDKSEKFNRGSEEGIKNRLKLLYNIGSSIAIIQYYNHVLVDFKPQNLLYTRSGKISLIDMDSIQLSNEQEFLFNATAMTPEYAYPIELKSFINGEPLSKYFDSYCFAVVAYQILFGIHPFVASYFPSSSLGEISDRIQAMKLGWYPLGRNKENARTIPRFHYYLYKLPQKLQRLFKESFDLTRQIEISEWMIVFEEIINSNNPIANPLYSESNLPEIFIQYKESKDGKEMVIDWYCYNTDKFTINGILLPISGKNQKFTLNSPYSEAIATNVFGNRTIRLDVSQKSLFCIKCGRKYLCMEDRFCIICGCKRM